MLQLSLYSLPVIALVSGAVGATARARAKLWYRNYSTHGSNTRVWVIIATCRCKTMIDVYILNAISVTPM